MNEAGITKNQIISALTKSPHGKLEEYVPIGTAAAKEQAEFFAHLIAYNYARGQVRDSKIALPVISLTAAGAATEFVENAIAHLALLDPRSLVKAVRFAKSLKARGKAVHRLVTRYLRDKEDNHAKWERLAVQHRRSLQELYALCRIKPGSFANRILFHYDTINQSKHVAYPSGSIFAEIARIKDMAPAEAASVILGRRLPFLVANGAAGVLGKDPTVTMALIERMTPTELVTNSKMLEARGIKSVPILRATYEQAIGRAADSKKTTLKATRAADAIEDEGISNKLRDLQEKQINILGGVDGNWAVLADKSGSMALSIETARHVAAALARFVKGQVHLVFFDTGPLYVDVTGLTYDQIRKATEHVEAKGGTSIGCALNRLLEVGIEVDGIAIVSDAQENTAPVFTDRYQRYVKQFDKEPPVYLYRLTPGTHSFSDVDLAQSMRARGLEMAEVDLTGGVDFYSLPDTVKMMRTNRYSLVDEIMSYPLLTLNEVFKNSLKGEAISV